MASSSSIPGITSSDITKVTSTSVTKPSTPIKKIPPGIYLLYPEDLPDTTRELRVTAVFLNSYLLNWRKKSVYQQLVLLETVSSIGEIVESYRKQ